MLHNFQIYTCVTIQSKLVHLTAFTKEDLTEDLTRTSLITGNLKVCALRPGGFTVQLGCPERVEASVGCPSVTSVLPLSFNDFTTSAEGQHSK